MCEEDSEIWRSGVIEWEVIAAADPSPHICLQETVNTEIYEEIFRQNALPHLWDSSVQPPIFIQDNAPCNTQKIVKYFLSDEGVDFMDSPPQSPDLNCIENV